MKHNEKALAKRIAQYVSHDQEAIERVYDADGPDEIGGAVANLCVNAMSFTPTTQQEEK